MSPGKTSALLRENKKMREKIDHQAKTIDLLREMNSRLCNRLAAINADGKEVGPKQAAHALGMPTRTLEYRMAQYRSGNLSACPPFVKKGGRITFLVDDISAFRVRAGFMAWHSPENIRLFSHAARFSLPNWGDLISEIHHRDRARAKCSGTAKRQRRR